MTKNGNTIGSGYPRGLSYYTESDVRDLDRETAKFDAARAARVLAKRQSMIPPSGIDFDANPADDPNFDGYNIPTGGNHP